LPYREDFESYPRNAKLGSCGTSGLYAALCVAGFLFIFLKLPETKGKSLEQIKKEMVDGTT